MIKYLMLLTFKIYEETYRKLYIFFFLFPIVKSENVSACSQLMHRCHAGKRFRWGFAMNLGHSLVNSKVAEFLLMLHLKIISFPMTGKDFFHLNKLMHKKSMIKS